MLSITVSVPSMQGCNSTGFQDELTMFIRKKHRLSPIHSLIVFVGCIVGLSLPDHVKAMDDADSYTDVIYLTNGDRITGNIKELDRGRLRLRTHTMDTIYINWVNIQSIESGKYQRIAMTDGSFIYGRLEKSESQGELAVLDSGDVVSVPVDEIAALRALRVNESFVNRLEGDIRAGIDYKKATDILSVNVASNIRLREQTYEIGFGFDWNETQRTDNDNASRAQLFGDYTRLKDDRWFWKASGTLERNDELGLKLRTLASGSVGRYFVQTSTVRWEINGGIAVNAEEDVNDTRVVSAEGLASTSFDIFILQVPITRLTAAVNLFPSITEKGRFRSNANLTLRHELVQDVFWDLQYYDTYDNRPADGAQKRDYGIISSIGATF
jgi:hypothetical protein